MRLNQILSSGPVDTKGRRILKSSTLTREPSSPVPVMISPDRDDPKSQTPKSSKYDDPKSSKSSKYDDPKSQTPKSSKYSNTKYTHLKYSSSGSSTKSNPRLSSSCSYLDTEDARNINRSSSVLSSSSHASSEGGPYRPLEISSIPPPLPARPSNQRRHKRYSQENSFCSTPCTSTPPTPTSNPPTPNILPFQPQSGPGNPPDDLGEPTYISSHFADEPLYQFYNARLQKMDYDPEFESNYEVCDNEHV